MSYVIRISAEGKRAYFSDYARAFEFMPLYVSNRKEARKFKTLYHAKLK